VGGWRDVKKWREDFKDKRLVGLVERLKILLDLRKTQDALTTLLRFCICTYSNTATDCNKLQHNATHCNTLQHTASPLYSGAVCSYTQPAPTNQACSSYLNNLARAFPIALLWALWHVVYHVP